MTIPKAIRLLLGFAALLVVIWSFVHVGLRLAGTRSDVGKINLTILHWGNAEEEQIVIKLVEAFEKEHPNVKIHRLHASNYDPKLKTMLAAGTPPDLFYLTYDNLEEFASEHLLMDLTPYVTENSPTGRHQAKWLDDFYPILLDVFRYDGHLPGQGALYGLPKDFTPMVTFVNLDLFQKAGVKIPYDGWTWDEYEGDMRKIAALSLPNSQPADRIYGGVINTYQEVLNNILWTYGGELFGKDGTDFRDIRLEDLKAQAALQMVKRLRLDEKTVFNATGIALEGGQQFYDGKIGCILPIGRWMVPRYRSIKDFRWDVVPLPHGERTVSRITTVAWTISARTQHSQEAVALLKFLCGREGQAMSARLGLAIPSLKSVAESDDFLTPGLEPKNTPLFLKEITHARRSLTPKEKEFNRIFEQEMSSALQIGNISTMDAARNIRQRWLRELDSPLRKEQAAPMPWGSLALLGVGLLTLLLILFVRCASRENLGPIDRANQRAGWMFIAPWLIGFALFTLGPMAFSLLLSFCKWSSITPLGEARFVGLGNYKHMLYHDREVVGQSLWVTVYYVMLAVPIGQAASLAIALLVNAKVRGIYFFRTAFYIPVLIGGVAMGTLWLKIFNNDYGLLNGLLRPITALFGATPPDWFGTDAKRWAIPGFVLMNLWTVGGGMILYLAALKGIPASYYEAARIDGAGRLRQFSSVTLPLISPFIFFNVVMALIGSFQVFTQAYVMTGPGPDNSTLFYVLNLYYQAFEYHSMGYASALAWVLFAVVLVLTLLVFRASRRWVYYEGLRS